MRTWLTGLIRTLILRPRWSRWSGDPTSLSRGLRWRGYLIVLYRSRAWHWTTWGEYDWVHCERPTYSAARLAAEEWVWTARPIRKPGRSMGA